MMRLLNLSYLLKNAGIVLVHCLTFFKLSSFPECNSSFDSFGQYIGLRFFLRWLRCSLQRLFVQVRNCSSSPNYLLASVFWKDLSICSVKLQFASGLADRI